MFVRRKHDGLTHYRGFTLVELLVVIGIISTLIAILLPALNKAREAAKTITCLSNMRQIIIGLQMYATDHRNELPPSMTTRTFPGDSSTSYRPWTGLLVAREYGGYIRNPDVFICPSRATLGNMPQERADLEAAASQPSTAHGKGAYHGAWQRVCYSANEIGAMPTETLIHNNGYHTVKLSDPRAAPDLLVLVESYSNTDSYSGTQQGYWGQYSMRPTGSDYLWTHGNVVNCAFLDGHCASVPAKSLGWDVAAKAWIGDYADRRAAAPWYWGKFTNPGMWGY